MTENNNILEEAFHLELLDYACDVSQKFYTPSDNNGTIQTKVPCTNGSSGT